MSEGIDAGASNDPAMTRKLPVVLAAAAALAFPAAAQAEPAVGVLAGSNVLAGFDTATPGTIASLRHITGLATGERVVGLDFRYLPPDGGGAAGLFALALLGDDVLRLYTIDPGTAVATPVGAAPVAILTAGSRYGFDFNPAVDRIRVVNENNENLRLNPNNGALAANDPNLSAAVVTSVAYDRVHLPPSVPSSPTTAYAIRSDGQLVTIGGIDGAPSANTGAVNVVGPLGVPLSAGSDTSFDISFGGTAYATLTSSGTQGLYAINLATGAATLIGSTAVSLAGFAVVPGATVAFTAPAIAADEASGSAAVTVSRAGSLASTTSVDWSASSGPSGTVTFAPGQASSTFSVPFANDLHDEPDEAVALTLSSPSPPATLAAPSTATLTIADDDPPADTVAPGVALTRLPKSIAFKKLRAKGIKVTVTPNEAARLEATLLATTRGARLSAFNLALATKRLPLAAGVRSVTLKPRRSALRRPRKAVKLRVQVTAIDAAGNRRAVQRTIRLKR
jgi:hypothetical protein